MVLQYFRKAFFPRLVFSLEIGVELRFRLLYRWRGNLGREFAKMGLNRHGWKGGPKKFAKKSEIQDTEHASPNRK